MHKITREDWPRLKRKRQGIEDWGSEQTRGKGAGEKGEVVKPYQDVEDELVGEEEGKVRGWWSLAKISDSTEGIERLSVCLMIRSKIKHFSDYL